MQLKALHRINALILCLFIFSHLGVHLFALFGESAHNVALRAIQPIYRNPIGETLLVFSIATQIVTGIKRTQHNDKTKWARLQIFSGLYLGLFLILHMSAALYTHHIFGLETDFQWAAGSLHFMPIKFGFAIYYLLAIISVFVHLSAAIQFAWPRISRRAINTIPIIGGLIGIAIILAFSGAFYPINLGEEVAAYYEQNFGFLELEK